jgi:hypothetical protein
MIRIAAKISPLPQPAFPGKKRGWASLKQTLW